MPCCAGIRLFVGSYNQGVAQSGIYLLDLDTATGRLTHVSYVKNVLNPAYLTLSANGAYLYACTEAHIPGKGAIRSYAYQHDSLKLVSEVNSGGENPVYLTLSGNERQLFVANYTGGTIAAFQVSAGGVVAAHAQVIQLADSSVNRQRQLSAHPHAVVLSPAGNSLFVPDLGGDKIRCYAVDEQHAGRLLPRSVPFVTTVPGAGPRHLIFSANGQFAYCIEELSGSVTVYALQAGSLRALQRVMLHKVTHASGVFSSADIHLSPDGRFLYASNRTENNIATFKVDTATGKLHLLGFTSVHGDHPRGFAIDATGKWLIVANQISGSVCVFKRDVTTGRLTYIHQIKIPGASCVKIAPYQP